MAEKALKQPDLFIWTGTDKRGFKVKGQPRGSNPSLIRADRPMPAFRAAPYAVESHRPVASSARFRRR